MTNVATFPRANASAFSAVSFITDPMLCDDVSTSNQLYWMCVYIKIRVDSLPTGSWDFVGCGRGFVHVVTIIAIISRNISLLGCLGYEGLAWEWLHNFLGRKFLYRFCVWEWLLQAWWMYTRVPLHCCLAWERLHPGHVSIVVWRGNGSIVSG